MVLESIINPFKAEKNSWELFFIGIAYGTLALFLSVWIFEDYASLVMVFFTVMASLPLIYHTLFYEESKDVAIDSEVTLLKEHWKAIRFLMLLFIGFTFAFSLWYVVLPADMSNEIFKVQTNTISTLNQKVTGKLAQFSLLNKIFLNNVKVLVFCILFSFIYGSGAIFILSWNASVIGAAFGNFIRTRISEYAAVAGFQKVGAYFHVVSLSLLRYSIHGVPEVLSYVIAGVAGGIISVAVVKKEFGTKNFEKILLDTSDLILMAVFLLFIAAFLEVFVTPAFF